MRAPRRWLDDESAPGELRELVRSARGEGRSLPLPAEVRARSAARLQGALALPSAGGMALKLKGAAALVGLAVAGVVVAHGLRERGRHTGASDLVPEAAEAVAGATPPSQEIAAVRAPAADIAPPPPTEAETSPGSLVPSPRTPSPGSSAPRARATRPGPAASVGVDSLAREAEMLHRARSLLDADPNGAISVLDAHASEFPSGHLALEREIIAVDALRRLQRLPEARARAEALVARASGTLYERRVRAMLESLPAR